MDGSAKGMTDASRLMAVRAVHTPTYVVVAAGIFVMLFTGVTGAAVGGSRASGRPSDRSMNAG